ncbi:Hypothetical protein SCF082_LOCUS6435 [Durusdinium trenchii]|uniref:Uncharacterized protein n=1 Tax=Durusdinium trenchii TaxID=1381693 RepID=A0ABP0IG68_9DINO
MATHVKVEKREESLGLGNLADTAGNLAFASQIQGFNDVLKSLGDAHGEPRKLKRKCAQENDTEEDADASSKDEDTTDNADEPHDDAAARKLEKRRQKKLKKAAKKARKSKRDKKSKQDAAGLSDSDKSNLSELRKVNRKLVKAKDT